MTKMPMRNGQMVVGVCLLEPYLYIKRRREKLGAQNFYSWVG